MFRSTALLFAATVLSAFSAASQALIIEDDMSADMSASFGVTNVSPWTRVRFTETTFEVSGGELRAAWASPRWPYVLRRTISLDGPAVTADYELEVRGNRRLPVLWSMHALIALEPGSNIVIEPAGRARLTHQAGLAIEPGTTALDWPGPALDVVRGIEAGQAAKLYLRAGSLWTAAARTPDGAELRFGWDHAVASTLGVWFSYGGWPADGEPRHQVALEPTTSPDDDLGSAIEAGRATIVAPGRPLRWTVRMLLVAGG